MKNYLLILLLTAVSFVGCKKEDLDGMGSLEVSLTHYSDRINKVDEGASVFLYKDTGSEYNVSFAEWAYGTLTIKGTDQKINPEFKAVAGANGVATIPDVPYGKYLLVVSSKAKYSYSKKYITIKSSVHKETKRFGTSEFEYDGEHW